MGTGSASSKDSFGPGNGLSHHFGLAMADERVTPAMYHAAVANIDRKLAVGAALRGELCLPTISQDEWIERERTICERLSEYGLTGDHHHAVIDGCVLGVGIFDRFMPGNLHRHRLIEICKNAGIKIFRDDANAADNTGEQRPTEAGVFSLDCSSIFRPTDSKQRPYVLDYEQQVDWAIHHGGSGIATVEQVIYTAVLRPYVEFGFLPYSGGSFRCLNGAGLSANLIVHYDADAGLLVSHCDATHVAGNLWALPRRFRPIVGG